MIAIKNKFWKMSLFFLSLYFVIGLPLFGQENKKCPIIKQYSLTEISESGYPNIQVKFINFGEDNNGIHMPYQDRLQSYHHLCDFFLNKKEIKPFGYNPESHPETKYKELEPGTSEKLSFDVGHIFGLNEKWKTIHIKDDEPLTGNKKSELRIKKLNGDNYLAVNKRVHAVGDCHKDPRLDMTIDFIKEFPSTNELKVKVEFSVPSGELKRKRESITFFLDIETLIRNISISVGDKQIDRKKINDSEKKDSQKVSLDPGQTHKETIDLNKWFKIPEKWKKIDIKLKRFHPALYKTDTLTIKRIQKESGEEEKKEEK